MRRNTGWLLAGQKAVLLDSTQVPKLNRSQRPFEVKKVICVLGGIRMQPVGQWKGLLPSLALLTYVSTLQFWAPQVIGILELVHWGDLGSGRESKGKILLMSSTA